MEKNYLEHCPSLPTDRPIQQTADVQEPIASTSTDDPHAELPTEVAQLSDALNPLELLANTTFLVEENEQLDLQEISLDDPVQLLELINQGLTDIIPTASSDETSHENTPGQSASTNIGQTPASGSDTLDTPGAKSNHVQTFVSSSDVSAITTSSYESSPCVTLSTSSMDSSLRLVHL